MLRLDLRLDMDLPGVSLRHALSGYCDRTGYVGPRNAAGPRGDAMPGLSKRQVAPRTTIGFQDATPKRDLAAFSSDRKVHLHGKSPFVESILSF